MAASSVVFEGLNMTIADHKIEIPSLEVHWPNNDLSRTALFVVDMQTFFVGEGEPKSNPYVRGIIPRILKLVQKFRASGGKIVWTRHTVDGGASRATPQWFDNALGPEITASLQSLVPGSRDHAVHSAFAIEDGDIVIDKYRPSAFLPDAGLQEQLQSQGIEDVVVVGTVTNFCCQSTARDALMLDYRVFFISDATAAPSDAIQNATLADLTNMRFFDLRTTAEFLAAINED
jgi:ureidoacrylate peracid hydrolase